MSKDKKFYQNWNSINSLFVIGSGHNDHKCLYRKKTTFEIDKITTELFNLIEKIYEVGARNFLILEIQPQHINPLKQSKKEDILMYNNKIIVKAKNFFKKHLNTNITVYNTFKKIEEIMANCDFFGFKDCVSAWQNNKKNKMEDYLWINNHLSEKGNKILSDDINDILTSLKV